MNTPTTPPTRRRWYQFGLGTMFVAVTVVAIGFDWLNRQVRLVYERRHFRETTALWSGNRGWEWRCVPRISLCRQLLGDEPVERIDVQFEADQKRGEELFPEAEVWWIQPNRLRPKP
jgi:hypothetical protein